MDITRRCDYACRILRVAYGSRDAYVSVSDIAKAEDIPYSFARSIQHDLVKAGLVKTVRGAHGGLMLDRDPADVTMLDILEALQGSVSIAACVDDPDYCEKHADCAYNKVWRGADRLLGAYFSQITLRDLFEMGEQHPMVAAAMEKDAPSCSMFVPSGAFEAGCDVGCGNGTPSNGGAACDGCAASFAMGMLADAGSAPSVASAAGAVAEGGIVAGDARA